LFKIGGIRRTGGLCGCAKKHRDETLEGRFNGVATKRRQVLFQQGMAFEITSIPCGGGLSCQSGHSATIKCVLRASPSGLDFWENPS
ncbi:MAG: hypothetical protein QGG01_03130, partial [Roseibacillus sp.]|nr:hypothetical protein [Roseibacillus sp.]